MDRRTNSERQMEAAIRPLRKALLEQGESLDQILKEAEATHSDEEVCNDNIYNRLRQVYDDLCDAVEQLDKAEKKQ